MSITYSEYVSVALGAQPAMRMRRVVICGLPGCTMFLLLLLLPLCEFWLAQLFLSIVSFPVPSVSNYLLPSSSNRLSRHLNVSPHYLINGTIFGKQLLNTKCVFWFSVQLLSATFLILRRIQRDVIRTVYRSACKVQLLLLDFSGTGILSTDFRKILRYEIS